MLKSSLMAAGVTIIALAGATGAQAFDYGYAPGSRIIVEERIITYAAPRQRVYVPHGYYEPRRTIIVERHGRPPRGKAYGWRRNAEYGPPGHRRHWRDRPQCWLPERYLCR